ncbi:MAG: hypothetical protein L0207_05160 [Chlamydiae bacterium]|nr:hypothetical protein [Chlamydiota bacterium]
MSRDHKSGRVNGDAVKKILEIYRTVQNEKVRDYFFAECEKRNLIGEKIIPVIPISLEMSKDPNSTGMNFEALEMVLEIYKKLKKPIVGTNFCKFFMGKGLTGKSIIPIIDGTLKMGKISNSSKISTTVVEKIINLYTKVQNIELIELFINTCIEKKLTSSRVPNVEAVLKMSEQPNSSEVSIEAFKKVIEMYQFQNQKIVKVFFNECEKKDLTGHSIIPLIDGALKICKDPESNKLNDETLEIFAKLCIEGVEAIDLFVKSCQELKLFGERLNIASIYCMEHKLELYAEVVNKNPEMMEYIQFDSDTRKTMRSYSNCDISSVMDSFTGD